MQPRSGGPQGFAARPVPGSLEALVVFIDSNFRQIAAAMQALRLGHVDVTYVAPERPRDGDFRLADGSFWNPGAGQGFYIYYNGVWNALGSSGGSTFNAPLLSTAPASPTDGMVVRANGTTWNPGSGRGFYGYDNATWKFLG